MIVIKYIIHIYIIVQIPAIILMPCHICHSLYHMILKVAYNFQYHRQHYPSLHPSSYNAVLGEAQAPSHRPCGLGASGGDLTETVCLKHLKLSYNSVYVRGLADEEIHSMVAIFHNSYHILHSIFIKALHMYITFYQYHLML